MPSITLVKAVPAYCCSAYVLGGCAPVQGQASDIRIHAEEISRLSKRLNAIYAKHTGQPEGLIGEQSTLDTVLHTDCRSERYNCCCI